MKKARYICMALASGMLLACAEEPPPPSVDDFMGNDVLLEATMVRCSANRAAMKYEPECVNAREAINRIARREEEARRADLEAQSERKRRALRRTQQAATLARNRAAAARKRREEQAYISQFNGETGGNTTPNPAPRNSPAPNNTPSPVVPQSDPVPQQRQSLPPEPEAPSGSDLQSIRDELKRRQETGN